MDREDGILQADLEERFRFEVLLADLSAKFVNLPAGQVDHEIVDAQRRICECLALDLCALWQWTGETPQTLFMSHLYRAVEGPPPPERMDADSFFPWSQQQVLAGRIVKVASMDELPPEAARDIEIWRYFGIRTTVTIPLAVGGDIPIGAVSFNTVRSERTWPDEIVNRLQLVAQIFANALARKRSELALRESEERLSLAAESAEAGLWSLDLASGQFWATEKARVLFQFAPGAPITLDSFLAVVHPEDRQRIRRIVEEAVEERREVRAEYRVVHPDGGVRWITSRGRPRCDPAGRPVHLMGVSMDITERKASQLALEEAYREIRQLKERLEQENIYLRQEETLNHVPGEILGQSDPIRRVLKQAEQVAPTDSSVLLLGETGTGKELVAEYIHQLSPRHARLMVKVNCSALPATLIESELFGREKGAFTGALTRQAGRFEIADGSTIFLDEIGDLPLDLQAKLLRVLQEGQFERLGSSMTHSVDVRIVAATNRDLAAEVKRGNFRQDLFYRLNVFPIQMPPLRERTEDIPLLVRSFVHEFTSRLGRKIATVPRRAMESLQRYPWPGNVRELRNVIERAVIISPGDTLVVDLPAAEPPESQSFQSIAEAEAGHIRAALALSGGRIKGAGGAAALLGLKPSTLYTRMKKLGIPLRSGNPS